MENEAQTGKYGQRHSRLHMYSKFQSSFLFFIKTHLVHIWAGLGVGWF